MPQARDTDKAAGGCWPHHLMMSNTMLDAVELWHIESSLLRHAYDYELPCRSLSPLWRERRRDASHPDGSKKCQRMQAHTVHNDLSSEGKRLVCKSTRMAPTLRGASRPRERDSGRPAAARCATRKSLLPPRGVRVQVQTQHHRRDARHTHAFADHRLPLSVGRACRKDQRVEREP